MTPSFIPRADLRVGYGNLRQEILKAVDDVLTSGHLILGPQVLAFEQAMVEYLGANGHAVGVGNGTDALAIALKALGIGSGDEVLTVANTAVGTASAIAICGATPVFCDIDPDTLMMDPAEVRRRITRRTRAIIPVHLFGNAVDMAPTLSLAREFGLRVVEDCAQSLGTTYKGQLTGTNGDVGCFSFYPTKNLGAMGDGGLCYTRDPELAAAMRQIRMYGCDATGRARPNGVNSRLDEVQAAILLVKLKYLSQELQARRQIAQWYATGLARACVQLHVTEGVLHSHCLFVVRVPRRDEVMERLLAAEIECGVHYRIPIHVMPGYRTDKCGPGSLPWTEEVAHEILSLPLFPGLTKQSVERVIAVLNETLKS